MLENKYNLLKSSLLEFNPDLPEALIFQYWKVARQDVLMSDLIDCFEQISFFANGYNL